MTKLSFTGKRILVGVALLQAVFCTINYYLLHLFEPFDKGVLIGSGIILGVCVLYFGPTLDELRNHQNNKRRSVT